MNTIDNAAGAGIVRYERTTHMNCKVRTRWTRGIGGELIENITLRCASFEREEIKKDRTRKNARRRTTAGKENAG